MRVTLLVWTVEPDLEATCAAYRNIAAGAARRCGCGTCRNFDAARPAEYAKSLRDLLARVGVDPRKEASVRLVAPLEGGRYLYAGSYAFCGEILAGRPYRGFPFLREEVDVFERVGPGAHVALRPWPRPGEPWTAGRCVRIEFLVVLPWVLEEPGAPSVHLDRGCRCVSS